MHSLMILLCVVFFCISCQDSGELLLLSTAEKTCWCLLAAIIVSTAISEHCTKPSREDLSVSDLKRFSAVSDDECNCGIMEWFCLCLNSKVDSL